MQLFYRKYGQGTPLLILHGLFGQCDNWQTPAKALAEAGFEVYAIDQRNHGLSPHSEEFDYNVMSADLNELIDSLHLKKVILLGHSMGGKTALQFANDHPEKISKLIVADIAPKYYAPHQQDIIAALQEVNFSIIKSRKEAEEILSRYIADFSTKQFLLKNIYWKTETTLDWRFNLEVIARNIETVGREIEFTSVYTNEDFETLFIRGEKSKYVLDSDIPQIRETFPDASFVTVAGAGHWLHADKPKEFLEEILRFCK